MINARRVSCLAIFIKQVNQIGTVTESIQAALDSKAAGWGVMVSHRSGETEDNFIADLSVGLASGQVLSLVPYACYFFMHLFFFNVCVNPLFILLFRSKLVRLAEVNGWPSIIR